MQNKNKQKIIIHSMMKTSTTSLGQALIDLNIDTKDHGWQPKLYEKYAIEIEKSNMLVSEYEFYNKIEKKLKCEIRTLLSKFIDEIKDNFIFSDFPVGHVKIHPFVKKIIFPDSKFIWIDRELNSWLKSVENWELTHPEIFLNAEKAWTENRNKSINQLTNRYKKEKSKLEKLSIDFPQDVFFMQIGEGWGRLCRFLDCEVPSKQFPFENKFKNDNKSKVENKKFSNRDIDLIRDTAILLENHDIDLSFKLISLAHELRPQGQFIKTKFEKISAQVKNNRTK